MALVLNKNSGGGDFVPHPETDGLIRAVIVDVTTPKKVQSNFGERDAFKLVYESEILDDNGKPFCVWSFPYTPSLSEKANLRKDLKKIRGRDLTKAEEDSYDVESLLGFAVQIIVKHEEKGGKTYAQITHVQPYKGTDPLKPSGKFVREKDRQNRSGGAAEGEEASYRKAGGAKDDEASGREDWQKCKVHVGRNNGLDLGDLQGEDAQKLIDNWLPKFKANPKPTADDKRLAAALESAAIALADEAGAAGEESPY